MASPTIKVKRSAVSGKIPTITQLDLGELAVNTFDGKVYLEQDQFSVGVGTTVIVINPWSVGTGTNTYNTHFTAGNVGVGSTLPTSKFSVVGNSVFVGITTINGLKFPSSDGTNGQVLQTDGSGNLSFGTASAGSSVPTEENFTASQGQTSFTTSASLLASYIVAYLNGIKLRAVTDFTTSTNTFTLVSSANINDELDIIIYPGTTTESKLTATQNQTIFTTTSNFTSTNFISVFVNGIKIRRTTDFTTTTPNTITFTSGLNANDEVDIIIN